MLKIKLLLSACFALSFFTAEAQSQANCNNVTLDTDTFYLNPQQDTLVSGNLFYNDSIFAVYPVLHLILFDTSVVTSPDIMVASFFGPGTVEPFSFEIQFKNSSFASNTVVNGFFHVYDSDMPGDSIVTCYKPITLILLNPSGIKETTKDDFIVYPNPSGEEIKVRSVNSTILCGMKLLSLEGKEVLSAEKNKDVLDVSELPQGIYILETKTSSGFSRIRFAKQ
jgi:hypothetical protein